MFQWLTNLWQRLSSDEERYWFPREWSFTTSGERVTPDSAFRLATVYACVRVLAETLAVMPCKIYRRLPDGRALAEEHPLYDVLHKQPNQWQTAFEWFEMMQAHVLLRGNAYSAIIPGARGAVDQLIPLHPAKMKVERLESGRLRYTYTEPSGKLTVYAQEEIFHLRGMSSDGIVGLSPISVAANAIGLTQAAETHGAALFKNGAVIGLPLSTDKPLTQVQAKGVIDAVRKEHTGSANHFKTYVLPFGLKPASVGLSNVDAQFLETRRFQRNEICSIFRVPPHLAGDLERATFTNIEHQSLEFIQYTMLPWLTRWEQAIGRDLIPEPEYYAEFLVENLLRGDAKTRAEYMQISIQSGRMSINEARRADNLDPIGPDGDKYYFPLNFTTLDKVGAEPPKQPMPLGKERPLQPDANTILKAVLRDTMRRMARMEKEAILRAAKRDNFIETIETWYAEHKTRLAEAIEPPFEFLTKEDAEKWSADYCEARILGLLKVSECQASELSGKVESFADGVIGNAIAQIDGWIGGDT